MQEIQHLDARRTWQRPSPPVVLHNTATEGATAGTLDENGHVTAYSTAHVDSVDPITDSSTFTGNAGTGGGS